jgi:hypothetical protein
MPAKRIAGMARSYKFLNSAFDSLRSPLRGQPTAVTALRFVSLVFALSRLPRLRFFNGLLTHRVRHFMAWAARYWSYLSCSLADKVQR